MHLRLNRCLRLCCVSFLFLLLFSQPLHAQRQEHIPVPIDFSFAGYAAGAALPDVPSSLLVHPSGGDDTALIQGALDRVAASPINAKGFRGAVLLSPGRFHLRGQLQMRAGGVVLRGSGSGAEGTVLEADGISRRTLIEIGATNAPPVESGIAVVKDVPTGARVLTLSSVEGWSVGDKVVIRRPSTDEWISALGMKGLPGTFANTRLDWKPGSHDLVWDRTITNIDREAKRIELDAPITTALESQYGGGTIALVSKDSFPRNIGVQDLVVESAFDDSRPKDEEHSWIAILLDNVEDAWVSHVTARHFVASAVRVNLRGRRITIEDCRNEAPVAEEAGYRRQSFLIYGQQVLVHRCYSEAGMNDFASGMLAGGPNVFLDCEAVHSLGASGSFEGWSSGVLYEKVRVPDSSIQLLFDFSRAQGAGWTAANSLIWNSAAKTLDAVGPPDAPNFVVRTNQVLYEKQLRDRIGRALRDAVNTGSASTTGIPAFVPEKSSQKDAIEMVADPVQIVHGRFVYRGKVLWGGSQTESWWRGDTSVYTAATSMSWSVSRFMPGVVSAGETEDLRLLVERLKKRKLVTVQVNPGLWYEHRRDSHTIERRADGDVWAPFYEMPWARSGKGKAWDGLSLFDLSKYNPWYFERQREFGKIATQNGLLVFCDLYNTHNVLEIGPHWIDYPWRPANNINDTGLPEPPPLRVHGRMDVGNEFYSIDHAPLRALHRAYIFHTLDELADIPNIVFGLAYQYAGPLSFQQFFLDTIREWEEQHNGKHVRVVLTTSKQTTDAILSDPVRSKQIAVVDMRYWEYRPDGTLFAPMAGENHAFRELISKAFPGYTDTPPPTTPEQVYRQVREYKDRYPEIALMPMEEDAGPIPILMAGAASQSALRSQPAAAAPTAVQSASGMYPQRQPRKIESNAKDPDQIVDDFVSTYLSQDLAKLTPVDGWTESPERTWVLAGASKDPVLIASLSGESIVLSRALPARQYSGLWVNPRTGETLSAEVASATARVTFKKPDGLEWLLLLKPREK